MLHALKMTAPNKFILTGYDIKLNDENKIIRDVKLSIEGTLNAVALYLVFDNGTPWKDVKLAVAELEIDPSKEASFGVLGGWISNF